MPGLTVLGSEDIKDTPAWVYQFKSWELVTDLAWSPDGTLLAVAAGNKVAIFLGDEKRLLGSVDIGAFTPRLTFSPDGSRLVTASRDGLVRFWKVESLTTQSETAWKPEKVFRAHPKGVNAVAFNASGEVLATGGNDAVARLWQVDTGDRLTDFIGGTYVVPALAFFPGEDRLVIANGNVLRIREIVEGRILGTLRSENPIYSLAINQPGDLLAAGDTENGVWVWQPDMAFRSGNETYPTPVMVGQHAGTPGRFSALVWEVAFSPNGMDLASAGGDGTVLLWNLNTGKQVRVLNAHQGGATCLAFSLEGRRLASGGLDASVKIWEIEP